MERKDTFVEKLYECNQHKMRLQLATGKVKANIPLSPTMYANLSDDMFSYIDQMFFRFSKLQDTMEDRIFPYLLGLLGEDVKSMSYIDRLNRLEELEIISANDWMALRKERNEIAHEYSYNVEELIESINHIYQASFDLLDIYNSLFDYCKNRFKFIAESTKL